MQTKKQTHMKPTQKQRKSILLFMLSVATFLFVHGQSVQYLQMSKDYFPPKRGMEILKENRNEMQPGTQSMWVAFSDRDNNPAYSTPGGSAVQELSFMEPCLVIDETDDHIKVVRFDFNKIDFSNSLIEDPESIGWVPKEKMLLWRNALVNPNTGFTLKALTVNTPQVLFRLSEFSEKKVLQLFNSPSLGENEKNENDVRLFQFLYILKEEDNALLIAKDEQIDDPEYASREVLGWVSKDIISVWDKRMVMEPNFDTEAVEERKSLGVKAGIFETKDQALAFKNGDLKPSEALWVNPEYNTSPKPPYQKRFPILDEYPDGTVRTGFITDVFNEDGSVAIKTKDYADLEREYARLREQFRRVNIMFVIDGTTSMKPYFAPIVSAIKSSENSFEKSNNDYRLGAVVYRDYPERNCQSGNRMFDTQELTKSYSRVKNFLSEMVSECYDCLDKDKPEAMYMGVKKAVQQFSRYPEQTNIIVLVGDAGNRANDPETSMEEVTTLLAKYHCSVLAYQVTNGNHKSYTNFIFQANDLITKSSEKIASGATIGNLSPPKLEKVGRNTRRLNFPDESPVPGSLLHPSRGGQIAPVELKREIQALIEAIDENQEVVLEGMDSKLKSIGKGPKMNQAMWLFLNRMKGFDKDLLSKAAFENLQLFINGYTSLSTKGLSKPLYNYQVLVNNYEVFELQSTLRDLRGLDMPTSELRKVLINSYKEILFQHYGREEGSRKYQSATIGDIMDLVTGLTTRSTLLNDYRIADLEDRSKVDGRRLAVIVRYVKNKLNRLEEHVIENEEYKFRSNDETYYWLPQEVLP